VETVHHRIKKADRLECDNYRGISLTCHSSKIFRSWWPGGAQELNVKIEAGLMQGIILKCILYW